MAVVAPASTVTLAGTVAAALPLDRATRVPPTGAGAFKVTVAVELASPPTTVVGFRESKETDGGFTVRTAVCETELKVAVIVEVATEPTAIEVTGKVVEAEPAGTVTLAGTVAAAVLLLDRVTTAPPVGAFPFRVTVAVEFARPPVTLVGFRVSD